MKQVIYLIILCAANLSLSGQCTEDRFCLSFANPEIVMGGSHFEFDLIVSSNSDFGLGTSNLQFQYNNTALSNPVIVTSGLGSGYQSPSITTPFIPSLGVMVGSYNLELNTTETGLNIPVGGVTVARLRFEITDPAMNSDLSWYYDGGTAKTIVYDDNESTQLCAVDPGAGCLQPSSSILPLDLVDFSSKAYARSIVLNWKTENELNSSHFEVERSTDRDEFVLINNTNAVIDTKGSAYSYTDEDVISGKKYYYRLKIVDLDGAYKYSKVISDKISNDDIHFEVYPNPAPKNESFFIKVNKSLNYSFLLLDSKRNVVMKHKFQENTEISLETLDGGIYFYHIEYEGSVKNGKLIIL